MLPDDILGIIFSYLDENEITTLVRDITYPPLQEKFIRIISKWIPRENFSYEIWPYKGPRLTLMYNKYGLCAMEGPLKLKNCLYLKKSDTIYCYSEGKIYLFELGEKLKAIPDGKYPDKDVDIDKELIFHYLCDYRRGMTFTYNNIQYIENSILHILWLLGGGKIWHQQCKAKIPIINFIYDFNHVVDYNGYIYNKKDVYIIPESIVQ